MAEKTEKLLRNFKTAADCAMELMIIFQKNGDIYYGNIRSKEELGYGEDLEHQNLMSVFRTEFQKEEGFSKKTLEPMETAMMYRKNGTCFPVRLKVISGESLNLLFAWNNIREIEMERRLLLRKEEVDDTAKLRNEFVANVTHELRTPVNGIKGHVSNLKETHLSREQREVLEIIERCCNNMSGIIDSILDFSKLEAGKFTIEEEEFDFYKMMDHVVETNIPAVTEKELQILVNIEKTVPEYVIGDELRLIQILNNLISNAVKFTNVGYISVEVTKTLEIEDEVELFFVISDTGIGISQEEQSRLFQSFAQADASITRKYGGTGLGLVITKELIELMGGTIQLETEKGIGSSFSFSIRLRVPKDNEQETELAGQFKFINQNQDLSKYQCMGEFFKFGSVENAGEIRDKMEKLVICLELGAWEKAERFAHSVKSLVEQGGKDIKKEAFRLEMNVRREDYEKSMAQYERLKRLLQDTIGGM